MVAKKLSIVVPVYNVSPWLTKCLNSLISQTYKDFEIICVNDGSTDDSADILKMFAERENRIKIINHDKNHGLFHTRITGIHASSGEYVAFVDSDDYVSCDWFRPLINVLEEDNSDMVVGNTINVDESGNKYYYNICRRFNCGRKPLVGDDLPK